MIVKLTKSESKKIIKDYADILNSKNAQRLKIIAGLLDDNGEVLLKDVIEKAYHNTANPINSINKSKSAIQSTAKEQGITLIMKTDNAKLDNDKKMWFEGEDMTKEKVLKQKDSISQPDSDIDNYATTQKKVIRYFVSYAHKDDKHASKFLDQLKVHIANRKEYEFVRWTDKDIIIGEGWNQQIQEALKECDFGLLLLSASFFSRKYIVENELSHFIKKDKDGNAIIKKSLFPVGLEKFDLSSDLCGLEQQQIFRFDSKFYCDLKYPKTIDFCIDCVKEIERKLKKESEREKETEDFSCIDDTTCIDDPRDKVAKQIAKLEHHGNDKNIDNFALKESLSGQRESSSTKYKVHELIDDWLYKENKSLFAVLGQYGMGKTFTLQKYTIHQLDKLESDNEGFYPFYFDLRKFEMKVLDNIGFTVWDIIGSILGRNKKADEANPLTATDVKNIWGEKNTLIIFDGLDEVLPHIADARKDSQFLSELFKLIPDFQSKIKKNTAAENATEGGNNKKMILSCRTDYFKSISAQYSFFQNQNREHIDGDSDYSACTLLPFGKEQILKYLGNTFPEKDKNDLYNTLEEIHNLLELSSRPVFLDFITEIFDQIEAMRSKNMVVTTANLYEMIINKSFERDEGKHEITIGVKKALLEEIAAYLWKRSSRKIAFFKLENFLGETLANGNAEMKKIWNNKESENLYKDLRNASFLTRSNESDFGFSHTSIQEYFLAKYIVHNILTHKWQNLELKRVSNETIDFIIDLLQIMDRDDLEIFNNSWKIAFEKPQELKTKLLFDIYIKDFKNNHILIKPAPLDLGSITLQNIKLQGSESKYIDLSDANFRNANLRNSTLQYINLDNADLSHADIRDSMLTHISMEHTILNEAILSGTLRNVNAEGVYLENADIQHTNILKSNWHPKTTAKNDALIIDTQPYDVKNQLIERSQHFMAINNVEISPDGTRVLSGSDDGSMKYWNLNSKKEIFSFDNHSSSVLSCSFSPDGTRALSGSDDGSMKYWNLNSKKEIFSFDNHSSGVTSCAFSPDGTRALSGSYAGGMKYWDLISKKEIFSFDTNTHGVLSCAFSPDGTRALSGSYAGGMKYWNLNSKKEIFSFDTNTNFVLSCAFSPDGTRALSGSDIGGVKYWDLNSKKEIFSFNKHDSNVTSCVFSPDGTRAISGSEDSSMKYWDLESKEEIFSFDKHSDWVRSCAFSPDGTRALSGSYDGSMKYWDLNLKKEIFSFDKHSDWVRSCAFSPDGTRALSGSYAGGMKYWDLISKKEIFSFDTNTHGVLSCAFSQDGTRALSASYDGSMKYWNLNSKKEIFSFDTNTNFVLSCAFSPDGTRALSGSYDGGVKYWDLIAKKEIFSFDNHSSFVRSCAFSPDGTRALSGSDDSGMKYWDLITKKEIFSFDNYTSSVASCVFSPDGTRALSASDDGSLKYWDLISKKEIFSFNNHSSRVRSCAFSPNGTRALSASDDSSLKYWDLISKKEIFSFDNHSSGVTSCVFSPDATRALSGSHDGTMRYWDLVNKKEVMSLLHFMNGASAVKQNNEAINFKGEVWQHLEWLTLDKDGNEQLCPFDAFEFG